MAEVLAQNGGTHTDHEDTQCSHMVTPQQLLLPCGFVLTAIFHYDLSSSLDLQNSQFN